MAEDMYDGMVLRARRRPADAFRDASGGHDNRGPDVGAPGVEETPHDYGGPTLADYLPRTAAVGQGLGQSVGVGPTGFVNFGDFLAANKDASHGNAPIVGGQFGVSGLDDRRDPTKVGADPRNSTGVQANTAGNVNGYTPSGGYSSGMANIDAMLNGYRTMAAPRPAKPTYTNPKTPVMPTQAPATPVQPVKQPQDDLWSNTRRAGFFGRSM